MAVPSSMHTLAKSMALGLLFTIMTSFPHDAMGGGFSSRGVSSSSSSCSRSRDHYSTSSSTAYVYRECQGGCCGYRQNYTPPRQNGMQEKYMEGFVYASIAIGVIFVLAFILLTYFDKIGTKTNVVKLQVALKGTACSLQRDLNHIALKADTSTQEGYKYILEESAKALLRHSEFWLLSCLSENTRSDEHQAERLFSDLSFQERSKFDEKTLVNVDNHQEQKNTLEIVSTSASPFIVVNLLVAITRQLNTLKIGTKMSVVKLQVALKGTACSLQRDLNHIALKADTSTQEGYKYILEESAKALLRHSEFWLLSCLSVRAFENFLPKKKLKSMALVLLTIMTSFPHDAVAASGDAMGGGFSSCGVSSSSSSGYRSRDHYSTRSSTDYMYRECRSGCCGYRQNYMPPRQNGMQEKYMEGFLYASIAIGVIFVLAFILLTYFDKIGTKTSVVKVQVALKGTACSLQQDLNHIALKADTYM